MYESEQEFVLSLVKEQRSKKTKSFFGLFKRAN